MYLQKLVRWSGLACILGGVLTPLAFLIHPAKEDVATILGQSWRLVLGHTLFSLSYILVLWGLVGLLLFQGERSGRLGLVGFALAFAGIVLFAASGEYGFIAPVLAARAPELLAAVNQYPPVALLNAGMILCVIPGFVCLGIATARAGVVPAWSGVLLAGSALLLLASIVANLAATAVRAGGAADAVPHGLAVASGLAEGVGLAGAGLAMGTR